LFNGLVACLWILCKAVASIPSISATEEIPKLTKCDDTLPSGSQLGTVVAIHGAPGSHKDYKYVTPLLQNKGVRFIGVNMPGFGVTTGDHRLRCDNTERNNFVNELVAKVGNVENLIVMGHSRGCENAVAVAAKNAARVLVVYAGKDMLIETEISRELASSFSDHHELNCKDNDEVSEKNVLQETCEFFSKGAKTITNERILK
ncbi:hypothetical protein TELCIR_11902, partial [Teladorsagia circumcincta]